MFSFGSKYSRFWRWFQSHEDEIFQLERNREKIFAKLSAQLGRIHPDLVFELSSVHEGRREFTVSAGGIKSVFPEVTALVGEAPVLSRWRIIAFRQRKDVPTIRYGDKWLDREEMFFDYASTGNEIDLLVFLPGLANSSAEGATGLKTIGYLFLDSVVGEYDVETKIARIEFVDVSTFSEKRRIPLRELAEVVDNLPVRVQ